jgi:hypothetical protein
LQCKPDKILHSSDNSSSRIPIATHLTRGEAASIIKRLDELGIGYQQREHHATSMPNTLYYELKVNEQDLVSAKEIVGKIKAKNFIASRQCPKCKTLVHTEIPKKGFWEHLFYMGTALMQCQKCQTKFAA